VLRDQSRSASGGGAFPLEGDVLEWGGKRLLSRGGPGAEDQKETSLPAWKS